MALDDTFKFDPIVVHKFDLEQKCYPFSALEKNTGEHRRPQDSFSGGHEKYSFLNISLYQDGRPIGLAIIFWTLGALYDFYNYNTIGFLLTVRYFARYLVFCHYNKI